MLAKQTWKPREDPVPPSWMMGCSPQNKGQHFDFPGFTHTWIHHHFLNLFSLTPEVGAF